MMITSNKAVERSKKKYKFPLITFTRRAKRKCEATENIMDSHTEIENKQCAQESESELCSLSGQSQLFDHDEVYSLWRGPGWPSIMQALAIGALPLIAIKDCSSLYACIYYYFWSLVVACSTLKYYALIIYFDVRILRMFIM